VARRSCSKVNSWNAGSSYASAPCSSATAERRGGGEKKKRCSAQITPNTES
jgi:hypothetical protein